MTVKFSIVIPLFNKEDHIQRAIDSVLQQKFNNLDIIVVDDGSTDRSTEIVKRINDARIRLISQENSGVSAARNAGIKHALGRYVAFLDADDAYTPDFLSEVNQLIKKFPEAGMYCTAYDFINPDGIYNPASVKLPEKQKHQLIVDYFNVCAKGDLLVSSSSVCIAKSVLNQAGGFPVNENMGEDQSLWSKIALQWPVAYSKVKGSNYFLNADNRLMNTVEAENEMPFALALQKKLDNGEIRPELIKSVQSYVAAHLLDLIRRNYMVGKLDTCQRLLMDARLGSQRLRFIYWSLKVFAAVKFPGK